MSGFIAYRPLPTSFSTLLRRLQFSPITISVALVALASTSLLYYYHTWLDALERDRRRYILHRRRLPKIEDRYASLQVRGQYLNPFEEWRNVGLAELLWPWSR